MSRDDEELSPLLKLIGVGIVLLGVGLVYGYWGRLTGTAPVLWFVNGSAEPALTLFVDGKAVAKDVPRSASESAQAIRAIPLDEGRHALEVRDATGKVVHQTELKLSKRQRQAVYAPLPGADVCFHLVTTGYGDYRGPPVLVEPLPQGDPLLTPEKFVDRWFEASPDRLTVRKGAQGDYDRALRWVPCKGP